MPDTNPSIETRRVATELTRNAFVLRGERYHLMLSREVAGTLIEAGQQQSLGANSVYWLPRGNPRNIVLEAGSRCLLVSVDDAIITRSVAGDTLANLLRQMIGQPQHYASVAATTLDRFESQAELIDAELRANLPGLDTIAGNALSTILVTLWRLSGAELTRPLALPRNLLYQFSALLDLHLRDHWSVGQYAARLGVSRERLTAVIKRATGKTPLALIHERLVGEARILLTGSHQQVAEIAFQLGFSDPAYFNRFFQRHQATTPARFRREQQHRVGQDKSSFAAWP